MAVTILRAQLAARMRLGRTQTELDEVDHLLAEATEAVIRLCPIGARCNSQHGRVALCLLQL